MINNNQMKKLQKKIRKQIDIKTELDKKKKAEEKELFETRIYPILLKMKSIIMKIQNERRDENNNKPLCFCVMCCDGIVRILQHDKLVVSNYITLRTEELKQKGLQCKLIESRNDVDFYLFERIDLDQETTPISTIKKIEEGILNVGFNDNDDFIEDMGFNEFEEEGFDISNELE